MQRSRIIGLAFLAGLPAAAVSQTPPARVQYPPTRTINHVDDYNGTKVADPYRWLEAIDSNNVAEWVKAQNAVTTPYLAALPGRDLFKQRITALYDFPRSGVPFFEGSRWFYSKNTGLQRQNVWYSRLTLDGAEQMVLDPNQLSPDGSIALSGFHHRLTASRSRTVRAKADPTGSRITCVIFVLARTRVT